MKWELIKGHDKIQVLSQALVFLFYFIIIIYIFFLNIRKAIRRGTKTSRLDISLALSSRPKTKRASLKRIQSEPKISSVQKNRRTITREKPICLEI